MITAFALSFRVTWYLRLYRERQFVFVYKRKHTEIIFTQSIFYVIIAQFGFFSLFRETTLKLLNLLWLLSLRYLFLLWQGANAKILLNFIDPIRLFCLFYAGFIIFLFHFNFFLSQKNSGGAKPVLWFLLRFFVILFWIKKVNTLFC